MINNFKLHDTLDAFTKGKKSIAINCLEVSPSDNHVLLGGLDGALKVYDRSKKKVR